MVIEDPSLNDKEILLSIVRRDITKYKNKKI